MQPFIGILALKSVHVEPEHKRWCLLVCVCCLFVCLLAFLPTCLLVPLVGIDGASPKRDQKEPKFGKASATPTSARCFENTSSGQSHLSPWRGYDAKTNPLVLPDSANMI